MRFNKKMNQLNSDMLYSRAKNTKSNNYEVKNNHRSDRGGSGPRSFPLDPPLSRLNTQATVHLINTGTIYCNGRIINHSTTVFSTFDMDQLGKIRRHRWNERLKISKIAKSESETSHTREDIAQQGLQTFVWWGGGGGGGGQVCSPHHTNVCKISRL